MKESETVAIRLTLAQWRIVHTALARQRNAGELEQFAYDTFLDASPARELDRLTEKEDRP